MDIKERRVKCVYCRKMTEKAWLLRLHSVRAMGCSMVLMIFDFIFSAFYYYNGQTSIANPSCR